jgi:hypothetical protein
MTTDWIALASELGVDISVRKDDIVAISDSGGTSTSMSTAVFLRGGHTIHVHEHRYYILACVEGDEAEMERLAAEGLDGAAGG